MEYDEKVHKRLSERINNILKTLKTIERESTINKLLNEEEE